MEFTFPRQVRSDGGQLIDTPPFLHASAVLLHCRNKGIYWWDSQVRGSSAQGVIDKDDRLSHD